MREIYLPAFEAAVTKGHVDAVMNSYNLLNGAHATQNEFLNLKVLKGEWGFKGILMSDWDATYDGVARGQQRARPGNAAPALHECQDLLAAVKAGTVKESTIDDKVLRMLAHRAALRLHRPAAVRPLRLDLLGRRPRRCAAGRAGKHHAAEERGHISAARRRQRSRPSPSSDPMPGQQSPAAAARRRPRPLSRSASSPASPTCSAQTCTCSIRAACRR